MIPKQCQSDPQALAAECARCRESLSVEELECPYEDDGWGTLCDDCYHECCEYTCCWCQNYEHVDHQHELLVVFEAGLAFRDAVPPGVYRITKSPYYTSSLISSGWLHPECLERVCDLPADLATNDTGYPCGHLCRECQQKMEESP